MAWHGYARIELNPTFADALDDPARDKIRVALKRLITQTLKDMREFPPYHLGTPRWRLDHRAVILEGNWDSGAKADFVREIAAELGRTQAQVNAAITITRFAPGGTWNESREACAAYIEANTAEWNKALP